MPRVVRLLMLAFAAALLACSKRSAPQVKGPVPGQKWTNSLEMEFAPVPGTHVLFSVFETRVREFDVFRKETNLEWIGADVEQTAVHPIANVPWDDAVRFCAWLTERERKGGVLATPQRYRLPTDAEWSLAAGVSEDETGLPASKSAESTIQYVWGSAWPPPTGAGNFSGEEAEVDRTELHAFIKGYRDPFVRLAPVGQFSPNRYGLYDLAGNLMEWCDDWFDETHRGRVARGGSWLNGDPRSLSATHRAEMPPRAGLDVTGFRCVLDVGN